MIDVYNLKVKCIVLFVCVFVVCVTMFTHYSFVVIILCFSIFFQGKFIKINFDSSGHISGANIETCIHDNA